MNKASQEAQSAELAYHAQIKHANNFMNSFQSDLMPRVMKVSCFGKQRIEKYVSRKEETRLNSHNYFFLNSKY